MAATTKHWTLEELHSLPEDGNSYELLHGELFVTPAPTDDHETIAARLARILDRYVDAQGLGLVYRPRVIQTEDSQLEPNLMVRQPQRHRKATWIGAPTPILVVEILSPYTQRRDRTVKRDFYVNERHVPEYWIVDPEEWTIRQIRADKEDLLVDRITWSPDGASAPLTFTISTIFVETR